MLIAIVVSWSLSVRWPSRNGCPTSMTGTSCSATLFKGTWNVCINTALLVIIISDLVCVYRVFVFVHYHLGSIMQNLEFSVSYVICGSFLDYGVM